MCRSHNEYGADTQWNIKPPVKRLVILLVIGAASLAAAGAATEIFLRWRQQQITASDRMDHGLVRYDPLLGWRLTPLWQGRHDNIDFHARYTIARAGHRNDPSLPENAPWTAVVGDSFTFGLGVNDAETFPSLLNQTSPSHGFRNFGVPGFSPDQELLLLQRDILPQKPRRVVLVVYLANDLLDILRDSPLQAPHAKPFFTLEEDRLVLKNTPVPRRGTTNRHTRQQPGGTGAFPPGPGHPFLRRSRLIAALLDRFLPAPPLGHQRLPSHYRDNLRIMEAELAEIVSQCRGQGISLTVALLPNRAFVDLPASASAQLQDFFRENILSYCQKNSIMTVDLATELKTRHTADTGHAPWYYPREGHLTFAGHAMVAEILRAAGFSKNTF